MKLSSPEFKRNLFQQLPVVYRERDNGDLEKYLEACGEFLDTVFNTISQRMADNFPDLSEQPDGSLEEVTTCQDWLLPYFAKLLDVSLVSPLADGKREEISNAVAWRKKKGTLAVIDEIAEAVGRMETEIQEGWKRVAMTPVIGKPMLPPGVFGYDGEPETDLPSRSSIHPGLPAVMVDFRRPSGAVGTDVSNPGVRYTTVNGEVKTWRQASFHGVPCSPGSFDDVSRRTVDLRLSEKKKGLYHPGRIMIFTPPAEGFFPSGLTGVNWDNQEGDAFKSLIEKEVDETNRVVVYRNRTFGKRYFRPVKIFRVAELGKTCSSSSGEGYTWMFQGLHFENSVIVHSGRVLFEKCAVRKIEIHTIDLNRPVIRAKFSLFKKIQAARGLIFLEYCTIIGRCLTETIQASDSIFLGPIHKDHDSVDPPVVGCIRYSYIPGNQPGYGSAPFDGPLFSGPVIMVSETFGESGCGVLDPASDAGILNGAEEGGEIGAYHDDALSARYKSIEEKLKEYLPLNLEVEIITDQKLMEIPSGS